VATVAAASEQELARLFARRPDVIIDSFAGLLTQFKANGMSGFLLADSCPIDCHAVRCHVLDREADDITTSKLAVDGKIEHCQISNATFDLELCPYRPDIFGSERRIRTDKCSLIPWALIRVFAQCVSTLTQALRDRWRRSTRVPMLRHQMSKKNKIAAKIRRTVLSANTARNVGAGSGRMVPIRERSEDPRRVRAPVLRELINISPKRRTLAPGNGTWSLV
jgi:hypothetical protein